MKKGRALFKKKASELYIVASNTAEENAHFSWIFPSFGPYYKFRFSSASSIFVATMRRFNSLDTCSEGINRLSNSDSKSGTIFLIWQNS